MLKRRNDPDFDPGSETPPSGGVDGCVQAACAVVPQGLSIPAVARVAYAQLSVGEGMRLVREPDAGDLPVRFDERRLETESWRG